MMDFEILTKDEAAERARISRNCLDRLIRSGAGPAVTHLGGTVRVRSDELAAWLDRCTERQATAA